MAATSFQLRLPDFEGPVEQLIREIRLLRLAVAEIALADVTEQFWVHLEDQPVIDLESTAEFARLVAPLLVMKAQSVLAQPQTEDVNVAEPRIDHQRDRWRSVSRSLLGPREGTESFPGVYRRRLPHPLKPRDPDELSRGWERLRERADEANRAMVRVPRYLRLDAVVTTMARKLASGVKLSLHRMLQGSRRRDAVTTFLATLELVRDFRATVRQEGLFSDIAVERLDELDRATRAS
ncbi:MAG: hypothetical protein ACRDFS_04570 [Chloroflexota bacterium]